MLYMYICVCVCVMYCVLKTSGQDAGGNTYNLHFINFYCNTCYNVNCSSSHLFSDQFSANNFMISQKFVVLVFYKKCIHFSFYSEDVLNVLCLFIHDNYFLIYHKQKPHG